MKDVVYIELNNWFCGEHYPDAEPYVSWMGDDLKIVFENEEWVRENKLCVVGYLVDMSCNYLITASREWVEKTCPSILTEYRQFLRFSEHVEEELDEDETGVYGRFDEEFLAYKEENIGFHWRDID